MFQAVLSGAKTFEIRLNDRGYSVGDVLGVLETKHTGAEMGAGLQLIYTRRECQRFVSHVLTGYGLAKGWRCLSFTLPHADGASAPVAGEVQWIFLVPTGEVYSGQETHTRHEGQPPINTDNECLYSALQASEAVRDVNALMAAEYQQWIDWFRKGRDYDSFLKECVFSKAQADKDGAPCSCPSGNGSLRPKLKRANS